MSETPSNEIRWAKSASTDSQPIIKVGVWSIGVVFLLFLIWGAVFELSSAVITPGTLVSEGKNKLIQHPIGGRVKDLFVREGERLEKGQIVLEIDPTQVQADLSKLNARQASLSALKRRLDAERRDWASTELTSFKKVSSFSLRGSGADKVTVRNPDAMKTGLRGTNSVHVLEPVSLRSTDNDSQVVEFTNDVQTDEIMASQQDAYRSGRAVLKKEVDALEKKIGTLERQRSGVQARIDSQIELRELTREELRKLLSLADKGYIARNRANDTKAKLVELEGAIKTALLEVASYDNQIDEVEIQVEKARVVTSDAASREYARIVAELAELEDQQQAAMAQVTNMVVRSPIAGKLTNLSVNTIGGVFGGGDIIGQIVPSGGNLLVEARVPPADIDYVKVGQKAEVAVTAFNRRLDDTLDAKVNYVSADSERDEKTNEQYFIVRLELMEDNDSAESVRLADVHAGMQAEVYINTGERTFLTYLSKPLIDSFRRAFRER